jgi:hypothetical protein
MLLSRDARTDQAVAKMVRTVGFSTMSLPPTETTITSAGVRLSRRNCAARRGD